MYIMEVEYNDGMDDVTEQDMVSPFEPRGEFVGSSFTSLVILEGPVEYCHCGGRFLWWRS
jgi:hypothetical protein